MPGLLLLTALAVASDLPDTPYDRGRFSISVANDDFGSDVDEAFTSGVEVIVRVPAERHSLSGLSPELDRRRVREWWGLVLGQEIYTPALLQVTDLDILRNDRRYAGWLYLGIQGELIYEGSPFLAEGYAHLEARLITGSTGPRTGTQSLQRYWHAFLRDILNRQRLPEDPKGWGVYQVPNHWGVSLEVSHEAEIFRATLEDRGLFKAIGSQLGVRMASLAEARVGNMWIDGGVGATLRAGLMPEVVFDEFSLPAGLADTSALPVAAYGFVVGRLSASAYNALLDGPPGAEGPWPERNPTLARLEAGFVLRFAAVEFSFR
ncbi:MAG: lipid A-modifier LpxR family protein, partial [Myxococcota bacterium]